MKIVVTGASGFIGRQVVAALRLRGHSVTGLVRPGAAVTQMEGVKWLDCPIEYPFPDLDRLGRPDMLIHLAWGRLADFRSLHHVDVELPLHFAFLRQLVEAGLRGLLVTGTCLEYGLQNGSLAETLPADPVVAYGVAKDGLRRQLQLLAARTPFALTWARLFYLHGPGQRSSALLPKLEQAIERGDAEFRMSAGEQLRDYLAVTDAAHLLAELATTHGLGGAGVVNVCSGRPCSVRRMVESHIAQCGSSIRLKLGYFPYPDYEPLAFWGNRDKLSRLLGQQAQGSS